jgi:hypothetical protein
MASATQLLQYITGPSYFTDPSYLNDPRYFTDPSYFTKLSYFNTSIAPAYIYGSSQPYTY